MIKEIKYNGFSASPGDHEALEGDLCVAMNLIPEHNTIRPVLPPKVIAQIPGDPNLPIDKGRKIVCIHQTSAFKHFIVAIEFDGLSPQHPPYTYLYRWDGTEGSGLVRLGYKAFNEVYNVEPVGNTLVVLTDTGIHYYLWKSGAYQYLGTHLPELDLQFYLLKMNRYNDDDSMYETDVKFYIQEGVSLAELKRTEELKQGAIAAANKNYAYNAKKHRFSFPFFVRYGLMMYDNETVTMLSAPALMALSTDVPEVEIAGITMEMRSGQGGGSAYVSHNDNRNEYTVIRCSIPGYVLCYRVVDESQIDELEKWKDIITHVRFYISPQFMTYNQDPDMKNVDVTWDRVAGHPPTVELEDNEHLVEQIAGNPNFYFLTELKPERLLTDRLDPNSTRIDRNLYEPGFSKLPIDFDLTNDNIVTRDTVQDDYHSHDSLIAANSFAYNSRINLANMKRILFGGFSPCCFWNKPHTGNVKHTKCIVAYEKDDGTEVLLDSETRDVVFDDENTILWFFYPDDRAKRAYFMVDNAFYEITLKPHNTLTGAYYLYLESESEQRAISSFPFPSSEGDRIISEPNKVYTSEVNNPFYFPKLGINSIGTGNVLGICAAVRPVSTGQMGYADLYIFADSGIWTAKINSKGTYSDVTLATGDICINPDSITQMETSVLFTTDRGIMLISGSQAQCISEAIDDDGQPFTLQHPAVDDMATMLGLDVGISPFKDFVRECRMVYDYTGQRIIVYNPGYNYAYIYSLESNKWGMMQCNIDYSVRAYPAALAVNRDGELVDCSVTDVSSAVNAMLITRPMSLDLPDVQKTVRAVLQRGLFAKRQGHISSILFASRDMLDWFSMMSSKDEDMRGFSGTGFKWFRIGLLLQLDPHESIQGCSIQYDTKYTNRLR